MLWGEWAQFPVWPFLNFFVFLGIANLINEEILRHCLSKSGSAEPEALIY